MYRSRLWTMRQYAGFGTAEESNRRYRYLLSQGTTGLSVAFDLPTQMGLDSRSPAGRRRSGARGRGDLVAGRHGAAVRWHSAGPGLDVDDHQFDGGDPAGAVMCWWRERQGADLRKLSGTIQNDILKEYIARGTYIYPPRPAMRIITDMFAWAGAEMPEWNTISISGYHIREAGSTAMQEVAFTFANAIAYIEAAIAAGLEVDSFAPRLSFFFNSHNDFLEEIAKFRAARRHLRAPDARPLRREGPAIADAALSRADRRQHAHRAAARRERGAHRAAGDGGGAGRRAIAAHQFARRSARRCPPRNRRGWRCGRSRSSRTRPGVTNTADPVGGSEHIEALTDSIERGVHELPRSRSKRRAARCAPSRAGSSRARFRTRRTTISARWKAASGSWWA